MGPNASQLEKEIGSEHFPSNEHFFGLVNFGNTCYCNSVLQALFFCRPFREKLLQYKQQNKGHQKKENLLTCLADLFHSIATQKKKVGQIAPKKFIQRLKRENELFDNFLQQDAHEFLNYLLNQIADILIAEKQASYNQTTINSSSGQTNSKHTSNHLSYPESSNNPPGTTTPLSSPLSNATAHNHSSYLNNSTSTDGQSQSQQQQQQQQQQQPPYKISTWIHEIFQGTLTNETRCLNCESERTKDEDFLDLSVDVEQNTSISHCLQCFSNTETMQFDNKYYCEVCCCKQEAQKRMRVKKLPILLALHLKRFKYIEHLNRSTKLSYRVAFPMELRLFNTSDDASNAQRMYDLTAVVVHCGSGLNRGHYITLIKSYGLWLLFDDDIVEKIDPGNIEEFFGLSTEATKTSESAYILFYQARESCWK